jgi:protein ImuA
MIDSSPLEALRRQIRTLDGRRSGVPVRGGTVFATGHGPLDTGLGGGLARGCLHECFACETADYASATAFALLLALLASVEGERPLFWLRTDGAHRRSGHVYGPGLADLGIDPSRLTLIVLPDEAMLLRAAADCLRSPVLAAVVIECWGNPAALDLTASRRLTLAAEQGGSAGILLRLDARPMPSAADTRWSIASAPSVPLAPDAPGHSAFDISLLRQRAGRDGLAWRLEWNRDRHCFVDPSRQPVPGRQAVPGPVVPVPAARPAAAGGTLDMGATG